MANKSLSHLSEIATQETNATGVTTPILVFDPGQGTLLRLLNRVSTGDAAGIPIFADLQDGAGNKLPIDTELVFRVERPTDDEPVVVSVKEPNISAWNNLTIAEQRNEENIDAVKINLKGGRINVRDKDELRVEVNSSVQIDWANSELYIPREAVLEESFQG